MAQVSDAIAGLSDVDGVLRAGGDRTAHMMEQSMRQAGLTADMNRAARDRSEAHIAIRNAAAAVESARRSDITADRRAAEEHHDHARQRYTDADARIADIQARIREQQRILREGPGG